MKCFEKILLSNVSNVTRASFDPAQFAYRTNRSFEDAVIAFLQNIYEHLQFPKTFVRCVFIDFSSALNTIIPHKLVEYLLHLNVSPKFVRIIFNFLVNRSQWVKYNGVFSQVRSISKGAPQGCVLSPIIFSLYSSESSSLFSNCSVIKYADDTVISGFLKACSAGGILSRSAKFMSDWCDSIPNLVL